LRYTLELDLVNTSVRSLSILSKMKSKYFILNYIWTSLVYLLILFVFVFGLIEYQSVIKSLNKINFIFIILGIVVLLLTYTFLMIMSIISVDYSLAHFKEKIFYSLIAFNLIRLIIIFHQLVKKQLLVLQLKKWKIIDISLIALAIAAFLTLNFVDTMILPAIPPLFVSISVHYIALFFICFLTESFWKTFTAATISGLLLLLFPTTYFINFVQFLFDYLIPIMAFSLGFFIHFDQQKKQPKAQIGRWMMFVIIPFIFVYISRVIAGIIFYKAAAWNGASPLLYSVLVNGINTGFDLIANLILVPIILSRLWPLKNKYQVANNR